MSISGFYRGRKRGRLRERDRYDESSRLALDCPDFDENLAQVAAPVVAAYRRYIDEVSVVASQPGRVLEIGAGRGDYSWPLLSATCQPVLLDYSFDSLVLLRDRAARSGLPAVLVCAEAEALPFRTGSLTAIVGVGVLGYVDQQHLIREVSRTLVQSGTVVLCDSVKGNPVYSVNRWLHVVVGKRSRWVVQNTPSMRTYSLFRSGFKDASIFGFGALSFLVPVAKPFLGDARALRLASSLDRRSWAIRFGFKVVLRCRTLRKSAN
jgi:SAM-dependent methyltransferase